MKPIIWAGFFWATPSARPASCPAFWPASYPVSFLYPAAKSPMNFLKSIVLAPETRPSRTEMPNFAGQRLGRANLTRGNAADRGHTRVNVSYSIMEGVFFRGETF